MEYSLVDWSWLWTTGLLSMVALYLYLCFIYSYWERKGIPFVKAKWFLGSFGTRWNEPQGEIEKEWYTKHGKIFGIYEGMKPILMVADPELLKDIFIKDFNKLPNQRALHMGDKILDNMVISLQGKQWRRVRSTLTPIFSASKIKKRCTPLMKWIAVEQRNASGVNERWRWLRYLEMSYHVKNAISSLEQNFRKEAETGQPVNCARYFNAFAIDGISRCAFDIILKDNSSPNNLFVNSVENILRAALPWRAILTSMFPQICEWANFSILNPEAISVFHSTVLKLLEHRRRNPEEQHDDILQSMLNCSSEEVTESNDVNLKEKKITQDEIVAQCVVFFTVGFVTTAATLGYTTYNLAVHSEYQEKLHQEITEVLKGKDDIDYDDVQNMKYLDAVISETLRYYTPIIRIERKGEEDYVLGKTGIVVPKGMMIGIPIYAIHHDPDWFPEPEKFNPDRFLQDKGHKIHPYTYLPFGVGPRNCLGMKFSQMEMKICLASVFRHFRFSTTPESKLTTDFGNGLGIHRPVEAIVRIEQRYTDT